MESDGNPMHSAHLAPRCHAKAKRTGQACKAPARNGWKVCRMHGAGGAHRLAPPMALGRMGVGRNLLIKIGAPCCRL